MRYFLAIVLTLSLIGMAEKSSAEEDLFVVVTSDSHETQMMSMVLSFQSAQQGQNVRVLLCDDAGKLALSGYEFPEFEPAGRTPQQLMNQLIDGGATVEVCAIFLPNRDYTESDLIDGIGIANPEEVARFMKQEGVRYFTF